MLNHLTPEQRNAHDEMFFLGYQEGSILFFSMMHMNELKEMGYIFNFETITNLNINNPKSPFLISSTDIVEQLLFNDAKVENFILSKYHSPIRNLQQYEDAFDTFFGDLYPFLFIGKNGKGPQVMSDAIKYLGILPTLIRVRGDMYVVRDTQLEFLY